MQHEMTFKGLHIETIRVIRAFYNNLVFCAQILSEFVNFLYSEFDSYLFWEANEYFRLLHTQWEIGAKGC